MNGWMNGWTDGRTDGRMNGWTYGWIDGRMDGRTDGWTESWMDREMDRYQQKLQFNSTLLKTNQEIMKIECYGIVLRHDRHDTVTLSLGQRQQFLFHSVSGSTVLQGQRIVHYSQSVRIVLLFYCSLDVAERLFDSISYFLYRET